MTSLSQILERKEQRRRRLEQNLPHVVEQLRALGALKLILFGSFARGDIGRSSDLDIIAVMPASLSSHDWTRKIYAEVDRGTGCDILAYSEADWQEMLPQSRFLRHALKEGKVLYETASTARGAALADPGEG